jgi:hypothetical protein
MRPQAVVLALLAAGIALPAQPVPRAASSPAPVAAAAAVAAPGRPNGSDVLRDRAAPAELHTRRGLVDDPHDGLRSQAATTFVVDPAAQQIHGSTQVTLTNEVPDRNRGNMVEQQYFYAYAVPVLAEATNLHATAAGDGRALSVSIEKADDASQTWVNFAVITLQPRLLYNQTQVVRLAYDIPYQPPRSDGLSRANDAVVVFPAFSPGDAGLASIEVRLPDNFAVEVAGDHLERSQHDGHTVLRATAIADPDMFTAIVVGTDDTKLVTRKINVDGREVDVRAWPNDAPWATSIAHQLADIMPTLTGLVGQPWPNRRNLAVVETASPYAHGYAGWYSQADHAISLGDDLDPLVVAHELSHVWFNADLFDARWIDEGLADEYAQTTLQQIHRSPPPAGPTVPDRQGAGALALDDWTTPSLLEQPDDATESYGYNTSWYVMDQIHTEIGTAKMRAVIAALARDDIGYPGDGTPETVKGTGNWQKLLDAFENVGGSKHAIELFDRFVANDAEKAQLRARTAARLQYAGLVDQGGRWAPPVAVRLQMSQWQFDEVGDSIARAGAVLDVRDDIDEALKGHPVGHLRLEQSYESADDLGELSGLAHDTLDAARAYATADKRYDRGPGLLGTVGLLGSGTAGRHHAAARQLAGGHPEASLAASHAVERDLDSATRNGLLRLVGLAVAIVLVGVGFGRLRARRRSRRDRAGGPDEPREPGEIDPRYAALPRAAIVVRPWDVGEPGFGVGLRGRRTGVGAFPARRAGRPGVTGRPGGSGAGPAGGDAGPSRSAGPAGVGRNPYAPQPRRGYPGEAPDGMPWIRIEPDREP